MQLRFVPLSPTVGAEISGVNLAHPLEFLYSRASIPEYQCRFKWRRNSIAFWDNRAVQHYAVSDYFPHRREMHRVTVTGDTPV